MVKNIKTCDFEEELQNAFDNGQDIGVLVDGAQLTDAKIVKLTRYTATFVVSGQGDFKGWTHRISLRKSLIEGVFENIPSVSLLIQEVGNDNI